ncbi:hypothetical protein [Lysinibacillus parviboronicapiens]|nr:hypothetical protein [Lysinibacillus parviboronicapiens]
MKIATGGNKSNKVNKAATTKPKVQESSASQGKVAQGLLRVLIKIQLGY